MSEEKKDPFEDVADDANKLASAIATLCDVHVRTLAARGTELAVIKTSVVLALDAVLVVAAGNQLARIRKSLATKPKTRKNRQ